MFIEFPKAMYRNGAYMAVSDAVEEAAAAQDGWTDYYTDCDRKNGVVADESNDQATGDVAEPDGVDALRQEAAALGVHVDKRWREARLQEEIAKAKGV